MADMLNRNADGFSPNYNWKVAPGAAANVAISPSTANGTPSFVHGITIFGFGANLTEASALRLYDGVPGVANEIANFTGNVPAQYIPLCFNLRNNGTIVANSAANTAGFEFGWSGSGSGGWG